MRHWLLIFMIALIPLRGWTGDAMSLAANQAPAGTTAPCHGVATSVEAGMYHAGPVAADMVNDPAGAVEHHNGCTACDICNGPALAQPAHSARANPPAGGHTAPAAERFASAVSQRGNKPPIA
jgi:hypothetical protein